MYFIANLNILISLSDFFFLEFSEVLKSSIGATGDFISVNSIRNKELWSPMLCCGEFPKDTAKSIPTTPNIQVMITYITIYVSHI